METNVIYNEDCYEGIKKIPDKSVDLVYIDIPYDLEGNGGGGAFGSKKRDYHAEYEKVSKNTNASALSIRKANNNNNNISDIAFGIDYSILDELCRVMKHIYIYGAVKNRYHHY